MIPTMVLFGLVFGRWWRASLVAAAVVWPAVLLATGVMEMGPGLLTAAGLAVLNAAAGVAVHQVGLWLVRAARRCRDRRVAAAR